MSDQKKREERTACISEQAQQPQPSGGREKPMDSRDVEEVDWSRLGNEQDVGG